MIQFWFFPLWITFWKFLSSICLLLWDAFLNFLSSFNLSFSTQRKRLQTWQSADKIGFSFSVKLPSLFIHFHAQRALLQFSLTHWWRINFHQNLQFLDLLRVREALLKPDLALFSLNFSFFRLSHFLITKFLLW